MLGIPAKEARMGGNDDDVTALREELERMREGLDSVGRQVADVTILIDRIVSLIRARSPELVPLMRQARDRMGATGIQVRLLRGRDDGQDADVRELHPPGVTDD